MVFFPNANIQLHSSWLYGKRLAESLKREQRIKN